MKQMARLQKIIIPAVTLMIGLIIGLGVGQFQIKKEQEVLQDKMKEASKKMAFIQRKMADEKNEATVSIEQRCQNDLDRLENEKKALGAQLVKLKEQARTLEAKKEAEMKEQAHNLEAKIKQAEEALTRTQKELHEERQRHAQASAQASQQARSLEAKIKQAEEALTRTQKELQEERQKYVQSSEHNKDLERQRERIVREKQALQAELERTIQNLGRCGVNNANLCIIAEELVKAYQDKGIGAAILGKEPLTQIKKVELEQLAETYRQEIEKQKIKKK
jgi:chromosome segregation ATPase